MSKIIKIKECSALCPHYSRYNDVMNDMSHGLTTLACLKEDGVNCWSGHYLNTPERRKNINGDGCFLKTD